MSTNHLPLNRTNIAEAHKIIKPYIHRTPLLTNQTLDTIASTPQSLSDLVGTGWEGSDRTPAKPKIRFWFKCENSQRIGAFKARGAFHALIRVIEELGEEEVRRRGVVTHSSGNHAQALALAGKTLNIPTHIVMPSISTPSKIASTQSLGAKVVFSGSTEPERTAVMREIQRETGAIFVPPYDHPDIILGQGTTGLEMEEQYAELQQGEKEWKTLDAVFTPIGGGGLNAGIATWFSEPSKPAGKKTLVFGAEPSFQGANDCQRGLAAGERVPAVSSKTIADGLRTPVGLNNWAVISDPSKVAGVYSVSDEQIKKAMKLVLERMKVVVEPSAVVGLAVCLFDEDFRRRVEEEGGEDGWDIGIVFSGGNTTVEAIAALFGSA
ncbi:Pyridoxal-phosphate dependent enzyme, putative [Talaromyces stipitatus ATCC 10500]|uniref:Pyridoxal-phosphate dependent enzyme, putative n=1 Tax=Talaromyces stipitatus (strain ATCC 10500 / CBS 375.48 / QM 6759 / NRRL 1006) TaxID=441959 RepID=B8MTE8_TALSN|nr:Pyridoxal-phosphate dependent enzyme, putative [Talaromyces stipitatus ATCC 10500]EED12192.1 Pyridoxal-phosphate dependent enzyme, putative [Talaromyces stipitatus ATCC 10500]